MKKIGSWKILAIGILLIPILLTIFTAKCSGQVNTKKDTYKVLSIYTASIVLNALGDGLNDKNNKVPGHICNALSIGTLLSTPLWVNVNKKKWYIYILSYSFIRFGIFSPVYNKTRNLPINYVGDQALDDKLYKALNQKPQLFERGVSFIIGISLPLNQL